MTVISRVPLVLGDKKHDTLILRTPDFVEVMQRNNKGVYELILLDRTHREALYADLKREFEGGH